MSDPTPNDLICHVLSQWADVAEVDVERGVGTLVVAGAGRHDALHLGDDDAARVARGHRDGKRLQRQRRVVEGAQPGAGHHEHRGVQAPGEVRDAALRIHPTDSAATRNRQVITITCCNQKHTSIKKS